MFDNINKVIGGYEKALGQDLHNRRALKSVKAAYDSALTGLPAVIMGAMSEHRMVADSVGTGSIPPRLEQLKTAILSKMFPDENAKRLFEDPTSVHAEGNPYGDGLRLLSAQMMGQALHQSLSTVVHELSGHKQFKPYIEPLIDLSEDVRKTLAYLKPIPNSFRIEDSSNAWMLHTFGKIIQGHSPNGYGETVFPADLARQLAVAQYSQDREGYQKLKQEYLSQGWAVDPGLESDLTDNPEQLPIIKEWFDGFYGDTLPPADIRKYGLDEEVRPEIRRHTYLHHDAYPVGVEAPNGVPESFTLRKQAVMVKESQKMQEMAELQRKAQSRFAAFDKPPPETGQSQQQSQQPSPSRSQSKPKPQTGPTNG